MQRRITCSLLILFLTSISLNALADENWYAKHYQTQSKVVPASSQAITATEIYVGRNRQEDNIAMLEQGYDLMGISSFEAGDVPPAQALAHGREIKADKVLVYVKEVRNATPVGQMEFIREARKANKELTEQDFQVASKYRYYASYWAKLPAPLLGVHVIKLQSRAMQAGETEDKLVPQDGVKVIAVIQNSPAAKAGVQRGDVLLALGGKPVSMPQELSALVTEMQEQPVELQITRDGEAQTLQAQIGKR